MEPIPNRYLLSGVALLLLQAFCGIMLVKSALEGSMNYLYALPSVIMAILFIIFVVIPLIKTINTDIKYNKYEKEAERLGKLYVCEVENNGSFLTKDRFGKDCRLYIWMNEDHFLVEFSGAEWSYNLNIEKMKELGGPKSKNRKGLSTKV